MRRTRLSLAAAGAALVVVSLGAGPALADGGDGDRTPEVVVGGLDAPRGLTVGWRGDLYVAQAGRGPAEGAGVGCIAGPEGPTCLGDTDKISRVDVRREKVYDVAKGLPSLAGEGGANAIGPSDVAFDRHGRLHATIGLGADPRLLDGLRDPGTEKLIEQLASINLVNLRRDKLGEYADIADFEVKKNPAQDEIDTNPTTR